MRKARHSCTLGTLVQDASVQSEISCQNLAIEWGQVLLSRLLERWGQIEAHETIAYEDKVAAQVRTLEEASTGLWYLHKELARACRMLKVHQKQLRHLMDDELPVQ